MNSQNKAFKVCVRPRGTVTLTVHDSLGNLKTKIEGPNTITYAGLAALAGRCGASAVPAFTSIGLGKDNTTEAASHTALISEHSDGGLARAAAAVSLTSTTTTNDTCLLSKAFTVTATRSVEEIGVFNSATGGTMLGRKTTGTVAVASGDTLTATYKIDFS